MNCFDEGFRARASVAPHSTVSHLAIELRLCSAIPVQHEILQLECLALQLESAKQLGICSHNYRRETHRDCTDTHGEIESPADEKAPGDRNGDQVVSSR